MVNFHLISLRRANAQQTGAQAVGFQLYLVQFKPNCQHGVLWRVTFHDSKKIKVLIIGCKKLIQKYRGILTFWVKFYDRRSQRII